MKPDWKHAPEWAEYAARDQDGTWSWYAEKPERDRRHWDPGEGRCQLVAYDTTDWRETLEDRPNE